MTNTSQTPQWVCTRCGTAMPSTARFCTGCGAPVETSAEWVTPEVAASPGTPSSMGRRFLAYLIDYGILLALLAVALFLPNLVWLIDWGYGFMRYIAIGIVWAPYAVLLAWPFVYSAQQGGKGTPGMRAMKLRLMSYRVRGPAGFGRAFGRNLVFGLASNIIIGPFTPWFDSTGEYRGWHEKASNTIMIDTRTATPGAGPTTLSASTPAPSVAATPPPPPPPAGAAVLAPPPPPPPPAAVPVAAVPVAAFAPAPVAAPASVPSVISAVPGAPARFTQAPDDENIDETRHAPARARIAASRTGFRLAFDDGTSHVVTGRSLVGRNPAASNGEEITALVALDDASKSLSKTHALLEQRDGVLHVTDRHSTNGSRLIAADGRATALIAGEATAVPTGASVAFGDRVARIEPS